MKICGIDNGAGLAGKKQHNNLWRILKQTCLVSSLSVYHYVVRSPSSCGLCCVVLTPLLCISALPLPCSCFQFRMRKLKPAGTLQHPITTCITSVREKLKLPSHLAWLEGHGDLAYVMEGGYGKSGWLRLQWATSPDCVTAGVQHLLGKATTEQLWRVSDLPEEGRSREMHDNTVI